MILKRFNVEKVTGDPVLIAELEREGYREIRQETKKSPVYSELKKTELVELAKKKGIKTTGLTKSELVKLLEK